MILADTSIWIELLNGQLAKKIAVDDVLLRVATCGPIVQEVIQGLRAGPQRDSFRVAFLSIPRLSDPLPLDTFLAAAEIYSQGRRRGFTIRASADCLIAAIAIENRVPVWHRDRDFSVITKYTNLMTVERI
jgi:predicted nucleic acid-binding protein